MFGRSGDKMYSAIRQICVSVGEGDSANAIICFQTC